MYHATNSFFKPSQNLIRSNSCTLAIVKKKLFYFVLFLVLFIGGLQCIYCVLVANYSRGAMGILGNIPGIKKQVFHTDIFASLTFACIRKQRNYIATYIVISQSVYTRYTILPDEPCITCIYFCIFTRLHTSNIFIDIFS